MKYKIKYGGNLNDNLNLIQFLNNKNFYSISFKNINIIKLNKDDPSIPNIVKNKPNTTNTPIKYFQNELYDVYRLSNNYFNFYTLAFKGNNSTNPSTSIMSLSQKVGYGYGIIEINAILNSANPTIVQTELNRKPIFELYHGADSRLYSKSYLPNNEVYDIENSYIEKYYNDISYFMPNQDKFIVKDGNLNIEILYTLHGSDIISNHADFNLYRYRRIKINSIKLINTDDNKSYKFNLYSEFDEIDISEFFNLISETNIGTDISPETFLYEKLKRNNYTFSDMFQQDLNINTKKNIYDSFILAISNKLTFDLNQINLLEQFLKYGNLINFIMDKYSIYVRNGRYRNYFDKVIKYIFTELDPETVEVTTNFGDGLLTLDTLPKIFTLPDGNRIRTSIIVDTGNSTETFISLNLVKYLKLDHLIDTKQKITVRGVCGSGQSYGRLTEDFTIKIENINFEYTFRHITVSETCGADILFGQDDFIKELWNSNIAVFGFKEESHR